MPNIGKSKRRGVIILCAALAVAIAAVWAFAYFGATRPLTGESAKITSVKVTSGGFRYIEDFDETAVLTLLSKYKAGRTLYPRENSGFGGWDVAIDIAIYGEKPEEFENVNIYLGPDMSRAMGEGFSGPWLWNIRDSAPLREELLKLLGVE